MLTARVVQSDGTHFWPNTRRTTREGEGMGPNLFRGYVRQDDDGEKPCDVLQQYTVDEQFRIEEQSEAQYVVVHVEHNVQTQRAQRQAQVDAEHIVQFADGHPDQPVFYFKRLDVVRHRATDGQRMQNVAVALAASAAAVSLVYPGRLERVPVPGDRVRLERVQIPIDAVQFLVQHVAQYREVRFHAVHADVLHVHNGDRKHRGGSHLQQRPQLECVDRYHQQYRAQNDQERDASERDRLGRRHRRNRVELVNLSPVRDQLVAITATSKHHQ